MAVRRQRRAADEEHRLAGDPAREMLIDGLVLAADGKHLRTKHPRSGGVLRAWERYILPAAALGSGRGVRAFLRYTARTAVTTAR